MNSFFKKAIEKPIYILLAVNIIVGLFVFRDYGLSWDEPLFYSYGDALGYAYSPAEWFSGHFDLNNSYGASGDDHKNRGPAYLFLARSFVYGLKALGSDSAFAWHLVNFLFFQLGIYFLYRLSTRWISPSAALFASAFFSYQPLLWGHAFINPKDPPFLTFFLASICLGFEMVDAIAQNEKGRTEKILLAAFFLGITTSIRVLGPFAGLLVLIYSFNIIFSETSNLRTSVSLWLKKILPPLIQYGILAIIIMFVTWPYLWESPLEIFVNVFRFMSDNPTQLPVLFGGEIYRAGDLPRRYMPFMLTTTLTEPTLPLFVIGVIVAYWKNIRNKKNIITLSIILAWFGVLVAYILLRKPAMYDGIRHFLFILPPIFIFIGFAFQFLIDLINNNITSSPNTSIWLRAGLGVLLILPGINGIARLHPYEYTYYNSFVGGTSGVFRNYETDYWLTCYKDAVEDLNNKTIEPANLFVKREAYIAVTYANENINAQDLRGAVNEVVSGDYVLVNTRTNEDRSTFRDAPIVIEIKRGDATFCIIRQIP
jgi:hypothetical protein